MGKLDELRKHVANLFAAATDKTTIENAAKVDEKINEIEAEQNKQADDYQKLLKDYKDVVLHNAFKPSEADSHTGAPQTFDADASFAEIFLKADK